ncbi:MAG: 2Fe-2S iron-sulfur cluster-binding protein [Candidatus Thorarchaeota archaeon]|jgi:ferredoxin
MPKVTVVDPLREVVDEFEVEKGTKLLKALLDRNTDIVHKCGGHAMCTTCRVTIDEGRPTNQTQSQKDLFMKKIALGLPQFLATQMHLSCQVLVEEDMTLCVSEWYNEILHDGSRGKPIEDEITPEPVWVENIRE